MWPTAGETARRQAAGETNWLVHHQNLEVNSFYSDPARPETLDFSSWSETFRSHNVVKWTKKSAMEEKDWLFSIKVTVHGILLTKLSRFAAFARYCFPAKFGAVSWANFFCPCSLFPLAFYFLISFNFARSTAGERTRGLAAVETKRGGTS